MDVVGSVEACVRPATLADTDSAARSKLAAARRGLLPLVGGEAFGVWASKRCSPEFIASRISGPGLRVVSVAGVVEAQGFVRPEDLGDRPGGFYLGDFYVSEPGRGFGSLLLADLVAVARRSGGSYVWSLVFSDNTAALGFFSRFGFTRVGERPNGEVPNGVLAELSLEL